MREIIFRGKRTDTGEWVYGYYYSECGNTYIIENRQKEDMAKRNIPFRVKADTIGQYTGLKDRNGKEIYEGDIIVQQGYSGMSPMRVRFGNGAFVTGNHKGSSTPKRPMLIQPRCKVIGNIHDNQELLEDGK